MLRELARRSGPALLPGDPLRFPHRYDDPADREIVAFLAAALAFGRVASVLRSVEALLGALGPRPRLAVERLDGRDTGVRLAGVGHRWVRAEHLVETLRALGHALRRHGSLEAAFPAGPFEEGLEGFRAETLGRLDPAPARATASLFASPRGGSACKRMCMFLRWVVRPADGLDLGLWARPTPAELVVPLDTHVARIGRRLGLTARRTPNWAMAREITEGLRAVDPADPLRFDFPLAHLGIRGGCPPRLAPSHCAACPLRTGCPTGRRARGRDRRGSSPSPEGPTSGSRG